MKYRAHLIIEGKVQGVFFRAFTKEVADSLGLKGWVRNLPNRKVEAVFEGNKEDIETAISRCYIGPPMSMVINIDIRWEDKVEGFSDFRIRY
ncbi:MAG: acylphosphatase [Thermodesulfovibrionales bacterium]|nr:acylphosphatase [Thermodesulfovibrionales bacterium]